MHIFDNADGNLPTPKGKVPETLPREEYATPEMGGIGGVDDIQIEGTGEAPMPFNVPQATPGIGPGMGLPGGNLQVEPKEEGTLTPDILPVEPFSIEGAEEKEENKSPVLENNPLGQNQIEAPMPTANEPIQLGRNALAVNNAEPLRVQETQPLPPRFEPAPIENPVYAPAQQQNIQPSSYSATQQQQAAPIYPTTQQPAPIYSDGKEVYLDPQESPISDEWRSRRSRPIEVAPLPETEAPMPMPAIPAEGRHVGYEQAPEAPMPEASRVPATIENAKPLALSGYCPVELVLNERWIEGSAKWTATHKGRDYQFSSREAFDSFCRSPELYAPYYSGVDPIVALVGGGKVDGRTDLCAVYRGRLYMFSSQDSLDQFRANPAQCVEAFEANLKIK